MFIISQMCPLIIVTFYDLTYLCGQNLVKFSILTEWWPGYHFKSLNYLWNDDSGKESNTGDSQ